MLQMGGTLKATAHLICVVYDARTGDIVHVHHDISLNKGPYPGEAEVEAAALAQVQKRGRNMGDMKTLHAQPHDFKPHARYKVNPQRRALEQVSRK